MQDPHENDRKQNQYWKVDIDPNAHLHDQEFESLTGRYYVVGIQIISRVFKFHNRTACPGDKFASPIDGNWIYHNHHERRAQHHWAVEVKAVDQALKTLSKKPNYRVLTNEFTDFKVYVGNVDHGVHMDVTRSLMAIFTAFERQFDAINTTTRIGGGVRGEPAPVASRPKLGYKYISDDLTEIQQEAGEGCKPMSSVNMSYLKLQGLESGYDIRSFLRIYLKGDLSRVQLQKFLDNELITHKNTVLDVSRMWDDKLIAYNPEYVSNYCMKKPTVAFRSHAGTLDSTEQIAWMDLCGVLTEYCYLFNLRAVHNWTRRRWTKPHNTYAILNILEHLDGKNNDTYAHYERVMTPINNPEPTLDQAHISCIFASFRTSTRTTLSRHSVLETDASTKTTGTSEKHTKISTYSSVPTTAFTESLVSTSTVQLIESTPPPVHIIVTDPPVHVTVAPAKARPTCCRYPSGGYPYIDSKVDTTCLDPLFVSLSPLHVQRYVTRTAMELYNTFEKQDSIQGDTIHRRLSLDTSRISRLLCLLIAPAPPVCCRGSGVGTAEYST
jgi:hypothetical protein